MTNTLLIRLSAIAAAASLVGLASTAAAGSLPKPLGAGEQPLSAGVHVLDLVSLKQARPGYKHLPRIEITLPSGWSNYNGWGVNDGGALSVSFWDVDKVYPTGCRWQGKPKIDPGRTVAGLARALATRPLRHASRPTNVILGGFHGKYLRWTVPSGINISRCGQGYFESWTGRGWATDRWQQGPGQIDRLWILDVHGKRLVIDAARLPTDSRGGIPELDRIVRSIKFLPASSRKPASATSGRASGDRNGPWIAFATTPAGDVEGATSNPNRPGSDVFVTRVGRHPKLVARRGPHNETWNVCPAFSPNGRMLAFARVTHANPYAWNASAPRSTIVIVRIAPSGPTPAGRLVLKVPGVPIGGAVRCPRWSANSSRLAYLYRGKVVIRDLDGSTQRRATGDPTIRDFHASRTKIVSPTGDLIATLGNSSIIISRPDGTTESTIPDNLGGYPSYAIAGWSPDGRALLLMKDVGGGFQMRAVSVDPPFVSRTVVDYVRVNGARSWPGYGDVSWQPIPVSRRVPAAMSPAQIPRADQIRSLREAGTGPARLARISSVTVSDINDRGQVVGSLGLTKRYQGATRGFVWKQGSLKVLGRGKSAGAIRINERGQILGRSGGHAVLWANGDVRTIGLESAGSLNEAGQVLGGPASWGPPALSTNGTIEALPFAPGTFAAMNNLGQVVGQTTDGRAAEWQYGELTDLGPGIPIAINDHGEIVGFLGGDVIVWRNGTPIDIGPGVPVALNERGQVIGFHPPFGPHGESHAFFWSDGTMTDLGTLGGGSVYPRAISDRGQVVGYDTDKQGIQHGFVWHNGVMRRLPSPKGYRGAPTRASAINNHNQIVGDNCWDCFDRGGHPSRFAVLWTLRGHKIETRRLLDIRR